MAKSDENGETQKVAVKVAINSTNSFPIERKHRESFYIHRARLSISAHPRQIDKEQSSGWIATITQRRQEESSALKIELNNNVYIGEKIILINPLLVLLVLDHVDTPQCLCLRHQPRHGVEKRITVKTKT
jgi:hypothetical protein